MQKKVLRTCLAVCIVCLTISFFVYYLVKHPEILHQITHLPLTIIALLLFLYLCLVTSIGLTLIATLLICELKIPVKEGLLITIYSSIINFFGPLQSGPVFRAVYLKKKYNLKIKNYTFATLIYYVFYAIFSGIFLISGLIHYWILIGILVLVVFFLWLHYSASGNAQRLRQLQYRPIVFLAIATLLQVCIMFVIYFTELRYVDKQVYVGQAIIYTGAANFALFVALTPGAIGFRESFLIFSRRLHHISLSTIVAANVIDRCMYILLLVILLILLIVTHTRDRFKRITEKENIG